MIKQGEDSEAHVLHERGWTISAIARHLGRDASAILRIAASLGDHHIPAHLARVLGSLDHANIALVTTAITRANG